MAILLCDMAEQIKDLKAQVRQIRNILSRTCTGHDQQVAIAQLSRVSYRAAEAGGFRAWRN